MVFNLSLAKKILFASGFFFWFSEVIANQALPVASFTLERSDYYGLIYNPYYANLLSPTSALGFEVAIGGGEFRLGATWAKILQPKHRLKFSSEYLAQRNQFTFVDVHSFLWNHQYAFSAGYSYLLENQCIRSLNLSAYQAQSNNASLPTIFDHGNNVYILYRDIKGSTCYGGSTGISLQPSNMTKVNCDLYYDFTTFQNVFEPRKNSSGLGIGLEINQVLHPRLLLQLQGMQREIYDQYRGKISWLMPMKCCAFMEFSLIGQYVNGDLPEPKESRVAVMLTYHWDLPHPVENYLTPITLQESIVSAAMKPLIRMPQTRVFQDQKIVNYP